MVGLSAMRAKTATVRKPWNGVTDLRKDWKDLGSPGYRTRIHPVALPTNAAKAIRGSQGIGIVRNPSATVTTRERRAKGLAPGSLADSVMQKG
jgi:hypothetical protein